MGKVYGIHEIELHPGVDEESLVKFVNQELVKVYAEMGWKTMLLKGDRGQRVGKYAVMSEIKNRGERDRIYPAHNVQSEESKRWFAEHKELVDYLMKKWASFSPTDLGANLEYTDYLVLD